MKCLAISLLVICICSTASNDHDDDANCSLAPLALSSIVNQLKSEIEDPLLKSPFLGLLQTLISTNSNEKSTIDCKSIESFYKRLTAQNTFALLFKDLCNTVLTYDDVKDMEYFENIENKTLMKLLINDHLTEDGSHWKMFYNDFDILGLNRMKENVHLNDLLLYWFGDLTEAHRITIYKVMNIDAQYNGANDPVMRYLIILMVEETGKLMFAKFAELYDIYRNGCEHPLDLHFVTKSHADVETGDLILKKYEHHRGIFTQYIVHNNERMHKLYAVGRQIYGTIINITMTQNFNFVTKNYQKQNLWDLE